MKSLTELPSEHKCYRDFGKMERVRPIKSSEKME